MLKQELENFITDKILRSVNDSLFRAYINSVVKFEIAKPFLDNFDGWNNARKKVALEQLFYHTKNIDAGVIDGFVGPQTRHARDLYLNKYNVSSGFSIFGNINSISWGCCG